MFVSLFPDWNARIEFKDSAYATFDGAKCMFKYYLNIKKYNPTKNKKDILAISVMDYDSKHPSMPCRHFLSSGAMFMDPWVMSPFLLKKRRMQRSF